MGAEILDRLRRQPAPRRFLQDEPGERMFAALLRRRGDGQHILDISPLKRRDVAEFQRPFGQRAGLVEGEGVDAGQPLQGRAALEQHAGAGQPAQRGDDRRRRRQDQGARAGDHQHRQRRRDALADGAGLRRIVERQPMPSRSRPQTLAPTRAPRKVTAARPARPAETTRQPVGGALERRLVLEGAGGQLDDPADDGVLGDAPCLDGQRAELVERAGQHLVARPLLRRQALAGQGADVHRRTALDDDAVGRHAGAGLDDDVVADPQFGDEDALFLAVAQPPAAARADLDDGADGALGALEGEVFQALAEQADEDDLGGDERPSGEDGGDAGDGQGQVGADAALEKRVERAVKDAGAAEDGGQEGEAETEARTDSHRPAPVESQSQRSAPMRRARTAVRR